MGVLNGFANELLKTAAAPEGPLQNLIRRLPGLATVGGGGAAVGYALGRRKGERQSLRDSIAATDDVARRAYRAGLERGAELLEAGGQGPQQEDFAAST